MFVHVSIHKKSQRVMFVHVSIHKKSQKVMFSMCLFTRNLKGLCFPCVYSQEISKGYVCPCVYSQEISKGYVFHVSIHKKSQRVMFVHVSIHKKSQKVMFSMCLFLKILYPFELLSSCARGFLKYNHYDKSKQINSRISLKDCNVRQVMHDLNTLLGKNVNKAYENPPEGDKEINKLCNKITDGIYEACKKNTTKKGQKYIKCTYKR